MKDLGDAVGGVTVDNAFAFDAEGIHYPKGKQHLGGWEHNTRACVTAKTPKATMVVNAANEKF